MGLRPVIPTYGDIVSYKMYQYSIIFNGKINAIFINFDYAIFDDQETNNH